MARTFTSAIRVLEALELLRCDLRIQVLFTVEPSSAFSAGAQQLFIEAGAQPVPWEQVAGISADLVVTASENVNLDPIRAPVLVLPHGVGFNKQVPDSAGANTRLSGLVPRKYLLGRDVHLVATHHSQLDQLERASPGAAEHTSVVGDLCFDRLVASRKQRPRYRNRLGLSPRYPDQRCLIVLSSTWGPQSLLGSLPRLPAHVLAELPTDEYLVALVLHPNIWSWHSPWQVRSWLAEARDAGLLLIPPSSGWQGTVLAADLLIGDHGSVTFYAAALGIPVLLAAFGAESVPGTSAARLAVQGTRLDPDAPLREQIDLALESPNRELGRVLAAAAFEQVGQAAAALRGLLYQKLRLPEPATDPAVLAWPAPRPEPAVARSFHVTCEIRATDGLILIERFPACLVGKQDETIGQVAFLAVYEDEPDPARCECAALLVRQQVSDDAVIALRWAEELLVRYPGVFMAFSATGAGGVLACRDQTRLLVAHQGTPMDPMVLAAGCYAQWRAGTLKPGQFDLGLGRMRTTARLSPVVPAG